MVEEARKFELQIRICDVCAAWSKVRHFQICFLLRVTSNWNHCWRRRSTCVLLLTFQSVISWKAQFMFSSVYFHSCCMQLKRVAVCFSICFANCRPRTSQSLPCVCAQQFSVDTLFSKFPFVLVFYVWCKSAKCKLIWIWRQDSHKSSGDKVELFN